MKHLSEVITAESLMKKPLDTQIVNAGGEGFNNTVLVERSSDSFSACYTFMAGEVQKTLITLNEYMVGVINDDKKHYVQYSADYGVYELMTLEGFDPNDEKVFSSKVIGKTFEEAKETLCDIFPNRIVWNLSDPRIALQSRH